MGYSFRVEFEPVALVDENILFVPERKAYKVEFVEPLPILVKDFGAITAGQYLDDQKLDILEMSANELAQVRFAPLDDVEIEVKQPRALRRFTTKTKTAKIDVRIWQLDPTLKSTEIFVFENELPYFKITNPTGYNLPTSRVLFVGFRYILQPLDKIPEKYTVVPVRGKSATES